MPARCLAGCGWAGLASIEGFASRLDLAKVGELKDLDTAARSASLQMSHAEVPGAGGAVHGTHQGGARSSSANCRPARVGSCGPHGLWGSSFFFFFVQCPRRLKPCPVRKLVPTRVPQCQKPYATPCCCKKRSRRCQITSQKRKVRNPREVLYRGGKARIGGSL